MVATAKNEALTPNRRNNYFGCFSVYYLQDLFFANIFCDYFFVLETNKLFGCAGFYVLEEEKRAHFTWGMVDGNFHKQGYGKILFQYRADKVKELYPGFKVTLGTSQYTYKYFEKLGMKVESITPNGFGNNYDRYYMSLDI